MEISMLDMRPIEVRNTKINFLVVDKLFELERNVLHRMWKHISKNAALEMVRDVDDRLKVQRVPQT